jgi:hypothetical protein
VAVFVSPWLGRHVDTDRQRSGEAGAMKQAGGQTNTCRCSGSRLVDSCLAPSKCTFELEHSTQHTRKHVQSLPLITHACTHKLRIHMHKLTRTQFLSGNVFDELFDVGEDLVAVRLGARVRLQLPHLYRVIDSGFDLRMSGSARGGGTARIKCRMLPQVRAAASQNTVCVRASVRGRLCGGFMSSCIVAKTRAQLAHQVIDLAF